MKRLGWVVLLLVAGGSACLAKTMTDQGTLRDVQPTTPPEVKKKHQQYDFSIATTDRNYTCRTPAGKNINVTDFVVGTPVVFQFGGKNGEVKTPEGKKVKCLIVRVENATAAQ
jgi:hypothetical protein